MMPAFDPEFDDARWTLAWARVPLAQVPVGQYRDGYQVIERRMNRAQIFDRYYQASEPFAVRALIDPCGVLWMSDTPQERMMMYNNALASRGHVLVGGLGLGMYPQYAAAQAGRQFTVVERSRAVGEIVGPVVEQALRERAPAVTSLEIIQADIAQFLADAPAQAYDTIFLDTWETLDAAALPRINRLRDMALRHVAPGGRVLLWGYRWMLRLFEQACRQLLAVAPEQRDGWLAAHDRAGAPAVLGAVVEHFRGQRVDQLEAAVDWCRRHAIVMT